MKEKVALRDEKVIAQLAKEVQTFEPNMFDLDLKNWKNREFVTKVMDKYHKKFDWTDDVVCEEMFDIAYVVENKKTILYLIKQKRAVNKWAKLADASDELFALVSKINPTELDNDVVVDFVVTAALSDKASERLNTLRQRGFGLETKTAKNETAEQILEAKVQAGKYEKNRSGSLKKQQDKDALQYFKKLVSGQIPEEKKPFPIKIVAPIAIAVVILGAVAAGFLLNPPAKETPVENIPNAQQPVDYNTDKSLVVADGDTVNIDYVGSIDGVEFAGGNTNGAGAQLTIGSGTYIDDFEEQLIGHNVGDEVDVNVTFPENYGNEELNGKEALFKVVINGIYK